MFNLCFQIQPKKKQIPLRLAHDPLPVLFHPKPGWWGHLMSILTPKSPPCGYCSLRYLQADARASWPPEPHVGCQYYSVRVPAGSAHQRVTSLEFSSDRPCVRTQRTMATLKVDLQTFFLCCSLYAKYPPRGRMGRERVKGKKEKVVSLS